MNFSLYILIYISNIVICRVDISFCSGNITTTKEIITMNQEKINLVMYQMNPHLDNKQLMELKKVLENVMNDNETGEYY